MDPLRCRLGEDLPLHALNNVKETLRDGTIDSAEHGDLHRDGRKDGEPDQLALANKTGTGPLENETKRVRDGVDGRLGVARVRQAADLDPRYHAITSRTILSTSGA